MNKQSAFDEWFSAIIRTPKANMSIYMRQLLKTAYFDGYDLAAEDKVSYTAGYHNGYSAGRKKGPRSYKRSR